MNCFYCAFIVHYMYNSIKYLGKMISFSIIDTITSTESVVSAHTRFERETHTSFPVVYENHEPIVQCFDMSSDVSEIDDSELERYTSLQEDIDVHSMHSNQSLVLYDALYIDCIGDIMYVHRAHSKDIVYNTNTTEAHTLNEQRLHNDYRHKQAALYMHNIKSKTRIVGDVPFVLLSMVNAHTNMLKIPEGILRNGTTAYMSTHEVCDTLQHSSLMLNVNNYAIRIHNVSAIGFDILRILNKRNVCVMCVNINFERMRRAYNDSHGYIEYINIHNGTKYTRNIEYSIRDHPQPVIHVYYDALKSVDCSIFTHKQTAQTHTTQRTHTATETMDTNTTYISSRNYNTVTQNEKIVYVHNENNNINSILNNINSILLYIMFGMMTMTVCVVLYKPLTRLIRRLCGVTSLNVAHNNENENNNAEIELENLMV